MGAAIGWAIGWFIIMWVAFIAAWAIFGFGVVAQIFSGVKDKAVKFTAIGLLLALAVFSVIHVILQIVSAVNIGMGH